MDAFTKKNNCTQEREMSYENPGVEEHELAIDNSAEKTDATFLYKGVACRHTDGKVDFADP
jgi:hypothetical protein